MLFVKKYFQHLAHTENQLRQKMIGGKKWTMTFGKHRQRILAACS